MTELDYCSFIAQQLTIYRQTDEELEHDIDEAVIYALIKGENFISPH
jgi:hypothetical protein